VIVQCPACGWESYEPSPDWLKDQETVEDLCDECHRELHGGDESRLP
jgi:hypothetical protein